MSHLDYFYKHPKMPREVLQKYQEGLILGSTCEAVNCTKRSLRKKVPRKSAKSSTFTTTLKSAQWNNMFMVRNYVTLGAGISRTSIDTLFL